MSAFSASVNGCLARSRAGRAACETGRLGARSRERGDRHTHQLFHRRVFPALFWRTKKRIISPSSSGSRSSVDRHVWNERTNERRRTNNNEEGRKNEVGLPSSASFWPTATGGTGRAQCPVASAHGRTRSRPPVVHPTTSHTHPAHPPARHPQANERDSLSRS